MTRSAISRCTCAKTNTHGCVNTTSFARLKRAFVVVGWSRWSKATRGSWNRWPGQACTCTQSTCASVACTAIGRNQPQLQWSPALLQLSVWHIECLKNSHSQCSGYLCMQRCSSIVYIQNKSQLLLTLSAILATAGYNYHWRRANSGYTRSSCSGQRGKEQTLATLCYF